MKSATSIYFKHYSIRASFQVQIKNYNESNAKEAEPTYF